MCVALKKIWFLLSLLLFGTTVYADEKPEQLYARSAVLMDADSGRVLFAKNGSEKRAMASTTKIMTCILALEHGGTEEIAEASAYAAKQPKVHLGVTAGERFYVKDLLYSLMLESHNDSAVIIAEKIGGSVEGFAGMMNRKAEEIGCRDTYFITPNGLDAADEKGKHSTTAEDLARMMSYCIAKSPKKKQFLEITARQTYQFSDVEQKRSFSCYNHNAFLQMMDGAVSGKTGFTGDAGYCYTGALKRDDRTFVVALLGCGWPNNRTYKWADTKKLMNYGLEHFTYRDIAERTEFPPASVENGIPPGERLEGTAKVTFRLKEGEQPAGRMLLGKDEEIRVEEDIRKEWKAPVRKGEPAGRIAYILNGAILREYEIVTGNAVEAVTFRWCVQQVTARYLDIQNKKTSIPLSVCSAALSGRT